MTFFNRSYPIALSLSNPNYRIYTFPSSFCFLESFDSRFDNLLCLFRGGGIFGDGEVEVLRRRKGSRGLEEVVEMRGRRKRRGGEVRMEGRMRN